MTSALRHALLLDLTPHFQMAWILWKWEVGGGAPGR